MCNTTPRHRTANLLQPAALFMATAALLAGCSSSPPQPAPSPAAPAFAPQGTMAAFNPAADPEMAPPPGMGAAAGRPGAALGGSCAQGKLYGDIAGVRATVMVSAEVLHTMLNVDPVTGGVFGGHVVFSGQIISGPYQYAFTSDLTGTRGYGDMVDYTDGARTRIQIDLIPNGFILTNNAFEGGGSTSYGFTCE